MNRTLPWLGVFAAALVAGLAGATPIATLALGMLISLLVVILITFGAAGMFSGLTAVWLGSRIEMRGTRSRMVRVVMISEVMALLLAVLVVATLFWAQGMNVELSPLFLPVTLLMAAIVIAATSTVSAMRNRTPKVEHSQDGLLALGLLGLTALGIIWLMGLSFFLNQLGI